MMINQKVEKLIIQDEKKRKIQQAIRNRLKIPKKIIHNLLLVSLPPYLSQQYNPKIVATTPTPCPKLQPLSK